MTRKKTVSSRPQPVATPVRDGLRGLTQRGVGEAGLNLEGQRRSNNFIDAGIAPNPNRRTVRIETRPRAPLPTRSPGTITGMAVGRRTVRRRTTP